MMKRKKIDYIEIINGLFYILMFFVVLLQVFARYVISVSIPWTEEVARYLLILITFIGGALGVRDRMHIGIFVIFDKFNETIRNYFNITFNIFIITFLVIVFKGSLKMLKISWNVQCGSIYWFTLGKMYLILIVSIIIMMIYLLIQLKQFVVKFKIIKKKERIE